MPNLKSSKKRMRQAERRRQRNRLWKGRIKGAVRRFHEALDGGEVEAAEEALRTAVSQLDKAATKGILHQNAAARRKSRLMKRLEAVKTEENGAAADA